MPKRNHYMVTHFLPYIDITLRQIHFKSGYSSFLSLILRTFCFSISECLMPTQRLAPPPSCARDLSTIDNLVDSSLDVTFDFANEAENITSYIWLNGEVRLSFITISSDFYGAEDFWVVRVLLGNDGTNVDFTGVRISDFSPADWGETAPHTEIKATIWVFDTNRVCHVWCNF